jgi:hypothetical protein
MSFMPRRVAAATITIVALGAGTGPALASAKTVKTKTAKTPLAATVARVAGPFSGPDSSGTQPAAAAAAVHALSPGTIFVENDTYVSGPSVHGHSYTLHRVLETPAGRGPQNELTTTDNPGGLVPSPSHRPVLSGASYVGGTEEIYSPTTDTIYVSSIWGPYLHPGPRTGTFVYRYAPGAPTHAERPLTITAGQARRLLAGELVIIVTSPTSGLEVSPPLRQPADGESTSPGVFHRTLRKLPITHTNDRLLSLHVLHPTARIDRNHRDYLRAAHGLQVFPG